MKLKIIVIKSDILLHDLFGMQENTCVETWLHWCNL